MITWIGSHTVGLLRNSQDNKRAYACRWGYLTETKQGQDLDKDEKEQEEQEEEVEGDMENEEDNGWFDRGNRWGSGDQEDDIYGSQD